MSQFKMILERWLALYENAEGKQFIDDIRNINQDSLFNEDWITANLEEISFLVARWQEECEGDPRPLLALLDHLDDVGVRTSSRYQQAVIIGLLNHVINELGVSTTVQ